MRFLGDICFLVLLFNGSPIPAKKLFAVRNVDGANREFPILDNVSDVLRSLGWEIVPWKAGGGYGGQSGKGNENASRERIAFSPHCLKAKQGTLF